MPLGFDPKNRAHLDGARFWTMVSHAAFPADGQVSSFQIYSGAAGRRLRIGIYRPLGSTCQFRLIQQKEWASFAVGVNEVSRREQEFTARSKMSLSLFNVLNANFISSYFTVDVCR